MSLIVVEPSDLPVFVLHIIEQLLLVRPATASVRHLVPAVLAGAVTVHVERDEDIGEIALRHRGRDEVDDVAMALEQRLQLRRDDERHLDLGQTVPARAGLDLEPPQVGWDVVRHPMTDLDPDAPRTVLDLRGGQPRVSERIAWLGRYDRLRAAERVRRVVRIGGRGFHRRPHRDRIDVRLAGPPDGAHDRTARDEQRREEKYVRRPTIHRPNARLRGYPLALRIVIERTPGLELVRITEAAAIAASHWMGHGDNNQADRAAVEAMRRTMDEIAFHGRIVIGEGERDEAPMLYIGEEVGMGVGPEIDIAVDPLEGTNPVAKGRANAIAVLAVAERGGLLHAPDTYMEKLVVGAPAKVKIDLDRPVKENLKIVADSLNREIDDLTVVILDRERHAKLIQQVRDAGARIKLIEDGDLMAAMSVAVSGTAVHAVMGTGGAPEGVLAAAALRCLGGEILGRLKFRSDEERARAKKMGITDEGRIYRTEDLASGSDIRFVATGVTDGELLRGVRFFPRGVRTHSVLLDESRGQVRFIDTQHFDDPANPPVIRSDFSH